MSSLSIVLQELAQEVFGRVSIDKNSDERMENEDLLLKDILSTIRQFKSLIGMPSWNTKTHAAFPLLLRQQVFSCLRCFRLRTNPISTLPLEILFKIFDHLSVPGGFLYMLQMNNIQANFPWEFGHSLATLVGLIKAFVAQSKNKKGIVTTLEVLGHLVMVCKMLVAALTKEDDTAFQWADVGESMAILWNSLDGLQEALMGQPVVGDR